MFYNRWTYYALYIPSLLVLALYMCTLGVLTPYRMRMKLATLWGAFCGSTWLRWGAGIKLVIDGIENVPSTGPYVMLANHQSEWETLYLPRIACPAAAVVKDSLINIPVYGWALRLARPIAVDRSSPKASIRQILNQGAQRIKEGSNVLIFAESKRVAPNTIGKYTKTGSKLAIQTNTPVLPVVHNAGDCWSPKRWFRPGEIRLKIGPIISSDGKSPAELTDEVERWARENYPGQLSPNQPS